MTTSDLPDLPAGWELSTLSDICSKITDGSHNPPKKQDSGLPMLSAVNVSGNKIVFGQHRLILEDEFEREDRRTKVSSGDVLLTIVGTIGRAAVVPESTQRFTLQRSVAVLKPVEVHSAFIMYQLEAATTNRYLNDNAKGTAQKGIYLRTLSGTPFVVPPLNEQQRIVEKIETLFARLDKGEEAVRDVQKLLTRYRQSVLKSAVTGQLTADWRAERVDQLEHGRDLLARILETGRESWDGRGKYKAPDAPDTAELPDLPTGWVWASVDQLARIMGGLTKNSKRKEMSMTRPMLRVANVYQNRLELDDIHETGITEGELARVSLQARDILVVEGNGSKSQIGRMAVWSDEIPNAVHQNHLIKVRLHETALAEFMVAWFQSPIGRQVVEKVASSTSGLYTLSISKIAAMVAPLPSLEEVDEIVRGVEEAHSKIAVLEEWCETELKRSASLRQSILKDAFAGKLVPQDPTDEPASALLARIAAEKPTAKKTRRKTTA